MLGLIISTPTGSTAYAMAGMLSLLIFLILNIHLRLF
jgi:hypothetical protein